MDININEVIDEQMNILRIFEKNKALLVLILLFFIVSIFLITLLCPQWNSKFS